MKFLCVYRPLFESFAAILAAMTGLGACMHPDHPEHQTRLRSGETSGQCDADHASEGSGASGDPDPAADTYTLICAGTAPGHHCGNDGRGGNHSGMTLSVPHPQLEAHGYHPYRTPSRTGWVALPKAPYDVLSALRQLVATLADAGTLSGTEPYEIFNSAVPSFFQTGSPNDGNFHMLCLGSSGPGGLCGNNGVGGSYLRLKLYAPQQHIDDWYHPYRTPSRTGWVAIPAQDYIPAALLLRLSVRLYDFGLLSRDEFYAVFNDSVPAQPRQGDGGPFTTFCLGAVVAGSQNHCGNEGYGGDHGDVFVGVSQNMLDSGFHPHRPHPSTGWVVTESHPYTSLLVLAQLTRALHGKGLLTTDEVFELFNETTPAYVHTWSP